MLANAYKSRPREMGERVPDETQIRTFPAGSWREPEKAWADQVARASVMAVHDDAVRLGSEPGSLRFPPLSREGDYRLREMDGLLQFSRRHGSKADSNAYSRQNQLGWQL